MAHRKYVLMGIIVFFMLALIGCSQVDPINLKPGEKLIELTKDDSIILKEIHKISVGDDSGKTLSKYVAEHYHDNYQFLSRSNIIYNAEGDVEHYEKCEQYKDATIVSFDYRSIKNTELYIAVPGEVVFILSSDSEMEFEVINEALIHMINWNNEGSADLVFVPSKGEECDELEGNYILYDYTDINNSTYSETISLGLEEYGNGDIMLRLKDWFEENEFKDYNQVQATYGFEWITTNKQASAKQIKSIDNANISFLGQVKSKTYIRVPKEIFMIPSDIDYEFIDKKTMLVNDGFVTMIYK